jgi:hypothetical protein
VIFESTADDTHVQKFSCSLDDLSGWKQIADLDGDNNLEIVLSTPSGHVHVFEATANDTWVKSTDVETGLGNALAVTGGVDTREFMGQAKGAIPMNELCEYLYLFD